MSRVQTSNQRRRRGGERGQVALLVALSAIVLLGATALAVDLTAQESGHRSVQNWTDAAALAGARDCDTTCNAKTEVQDALAVLLRNSPWSSTSSWTTSAPLSTCTASACVLSNYAGPSPYANYRVSVSSPPVAPRNPSYNTVNYVEVDVAATTSTNLAAVIGATSTLSTGHSIATDTGPAGPYQYAFFAKVLAESGNHSEVIAGDAYVGGGYTNQSNGQASLCVNEVAESTDDTDPGLDSGSANDSDVDDQGHVVFSTIPPLYGPDPTYGVGPFNTTTSPCPTGGSLNAQSVAPGPVATTNCPAGSTATSYASLIPPSPGSTVYACVAPAPPVPAVVAPTPNQTACSGATGKIMQGATHGVYSVGTATTPCALTIDFGSGKKNTGNIDCVTLVLAPGSTINVVNKSSTQYMTSYGYAPDSATDTAFSNDGFNPAPGPCEGSNTPADKTVIYAPDTSVTPMPTALTNTSTGCCSTTLFIGNIFLPDQVIDFATNQSLEDVGGIYCGEWNVQSGYHPNPVVTYDAGAAGGIPQGLRIAE